ncbi:MAG: hypothetical protein KGR26_12115 [Cyanobacteria bacterium REEB65]|nr:hypothetical protein [Cyanobacteria bacterium REEB65]
MVRSAWLLALAGTCLLASCEDPQPAGGGSLESYLTYQVPPTYLHPPAAVRLGGGAGPVQPPGPGQIRQRPGAIPPYASPEPPSAAGPDTEPGDTIGGPRGGQPKVPFTGLR